MRKTIALPIAATLIAAGAATAHLNWNGHDPKPVAATKVTKVTKITEDDPRWNCHTMGNRICGPVNPPAGFIRTSTGHLVKVKGRTCIFLTYGEQGYANPTDPTDGEFYCIR